MHRILRHRLVIVGVVLAFAAGGGAAYAASQSSANSRGAFLTDVAKRLNVSPQRLTSAIKAAVIDRLTAAVKAGRLTRTEASAIEHQIEAKGPPFAFQPGPGAFRPGPGSLRPGPGSFRHRPGLFVGPGPFAQAKPLAGVAAYLGLTEPQLFNELHSGHSLARIAKARGKSVAGLERAITTAIKSKLDQAVAAKRVTKAQEQQQLSSLSSELHVLINRVAPRFGAWREGPPGAWAHPSSAPPF